jgi:DNA-binding response OmpR family regulator
MRVLLIVDRQLAEALKPGLAQDQCLVEFTDTPEKADYRAQTEEYDAVVVDRDVMRDGLLSSLLRWRRSGLKAHVLVLLPAVGTGQDRTSVLDAGADSYLLRPVNEDELRARLRALRRQQESLDPVRRIHDLEINTRERTVTRGGQPIHLTPREFDLLSFLAYHQGRVVTRSMIRQHLYEHLDGETNSNVVDVYIRYLRTKIDKGHHPALILTRWGQGYLLRADHH